MVWAAGFFYSMNHVGGFLDKHQSFCDCRQFSADFHILTKVKVTSALRGGGSGPEEGGEGRRTEGMFRSNTTKTKSE